MALNYTTLVSQVSNLAVIPSTDPNFQTMFPGAIDYMEQRLYRELDLINTQGVDAADTTSSGNRLFSVPLFSSGYFVTVDAVNIITPAGTNALNGTRNPCMPVTREFLDLTYPSGQISTGVPQYFAMQSNSEMIFGPPPDDGYRVEVIGTVRPNALSSANSSTFLTQYCPDLVVAAMMVFVSGYMRDFGAQADNPGMSQSWETQYQTLIKSASIEQARAKFQSEGWTSEQPSPVARRS